LDNAKLLEELGETAREAGSAILEIVRRGFDVEHKQDSSPVTEADRAAELIILAALAKAAPGVPVIAEEEVGTKEFVRGGDDYTVNIGLIAEGVPLLGAVYAPATDTLHAGLVSKGAWMVDSAGRRDIRVRERGEQLVAVASKSHFNQPTADYLAEAAGECGYLAIGSSLKFCVVADGRADIYPRLSPTSEWDTAAGHAVLLAAGGRVDGPDGRPLAYGKRAFLNRGFVATSGFAAPQIGPFMEPFSGGGDLPQGV